MSRTMVTQTWERFNSKHDLDLVQLNSRKLKLKLSWIEFCDLILMYFCCVHAGRATNTVKAKSHSFQGLHTAREVRCCQRSYREAQVVLQLPIRLLNSHNSFITVSSWKVCFQSCVSVSLSLGDTHVTSTITIMHLISLDREHPWHVQT